jgi:hypothetical protein
VKCSALFSLRLSRPIAHPSPEPLRLKRQHDRGVLAGKLSPQSDQRFACLTVVAAFPAAAVRTRDAGMTLENPLNATSAFNGAPAA